MKNLLPPLFTVLVFAALILIAPWVLKIMGIYGDWVMKF